MPFRRRRWDEQPTAPCEVLLASDGRREFSKRAVAQAAALANEGSVGVVTISKIYGTQFGLPHPGLLPTKKELDERESWVKGAIQALERQGLVADGQVAATRKVTKKLVAVARARRPRVIVIDETPYTGWRRFVEGDVGSELRKKLRKDGIEVEIIPAKWSGD
jgi:ABC-type branched-subunit amino acid transport system ATPase component